MEIQRDVNDNLLSKRKVNGIIKVLVNDGLKLMELLGDAIIPDREIFGKVRQVSDGAGGEKLCEESLNENGQKKSRNIKGAVKLTGNYRFSDKKNKANRQPKSGIVNDEDYEIDSARIIIDDNGHRKLLLDCKLKNGTSKEMIIDQGGMILEASDKELYEVKENGEDRPLHGTIKVLGDEEDLYMIEELNCSDGSVVSRIIKGLVKVREPTNSGSPNKRIQDINVHKGAGKDDDDYYEPKGDLKSVYNPERNQDEVHEQFFDHTLKRMDDKNIATISHQTKVIPSGLSFDEF